jgi:hypothetical protein
MAAATLTRLSTGQIEELDPYALMAVLGKRVIHPGGRRATDFLHDEGLANTARVLGTAMTRATYLKRMAWLMRRMRHAVPYLGYIALSGTKPA